MAAVRESWCEVFGARPEETDDFFAAGGQSVSAVRLVAAIRARTGVELPASLVLRLRTPGRLAEAVSGGGDGLWVPTAAAADVAPLTAAQEGFWRIYRAIPEATGFNCYVRLRVEGTLDVPALTEALHAVAIRQAALRTVVPDGERQVVLPHPDIDLREFDLTAASVSPDAVSETLRTLVDEPFDLRAAPAFRVILVQLSDASHILVMVVHHIVFDGWSRQVLVDDLTHAYSWARGEADVPEPLSLSFPDVARWEADRFSGDRLARDLRFWQEAIAGRGLSPLPLSSGARRTYRSTSFTFEAGADLTALRRLARRAEVTTSMLLLAVYVRAVALTLGVRDVCVANLIANRELPSTTRLVGLFANVQLLRLRVAPDAPLAGLARDVRESTIAAVPHQGLPFEVLLPHLSAQPGIDHSALLQLGFAVQLPQGHGEATADGRVQFQGDRTLGRTVTEELNPSPFALTLELLETGGVLVGKAEYRDDVDVARVRRIIDDVRSTLRDIHHEKE